MAQRFDLALVALEPTRYRVVGTTAEGSVESTIRWPFTELELENYILKIGGRTRRTRRFAGSPEESEAKEFGSRLFDAVLSGAVGQRYMSELARVGAAGSALQLRINLAGAPELQAVPWEFLYRADLDFLCRSTRTPVVRFMEVSRRAPPARATKQIRVAAVISNPSDQAPLETQREWRSLQERLSELTDAGHIAISRVEPSVSALQAHLRRLDRLDVLHYVGHGMFDPRTQTGSLIFEDEHGRSAPVSGVRLSALLEDSPPQLVVLNSCEGARAGVSDPFSGVAHALLSRTIPAVIAMQFEITDDAALTFSRELYAALADGDAIDSAVAEARKAVFLSGNDIEWATPVLYLQTDGLSLIEPRPSDRVPADADDQPIRDDTLHAPSPVRDQPEEWASEEPSTTEAHDHLTCPACGTKNEPGRSSCVLCGVRLDTGADPGASGVTTTPTGRGWMWAAVGALATVALVGWLLTRDVTQISLRAIQLVGVQVDDGPLVRARPGDGPCWDFAADDGTLWVHDVRAGRLVVDDLTGRPDDGESIGAPSDECGGGLALVGESAIVTSADGTAWRVDPGTSESTDLEEPVVAGSRPEHHLSQVALVTADSMVLIDPSDVSERQTHQFRTPPESVRGFASYENVAVILGTRTIAVEHTDGIGFRERELRVPMHVDHANTALDVKALSTRDGIVLYGPTAEYAPLLVSTDTFDLKPGHALNFLPTDAYSTNGALYLTGIEPIHDNLPVTQGEEYIFQISVVKLDLPTLRGDPQGSHDISFVAAHTGRLEPAASLALVGDHLVLAGRCSIRVDGDSLPCGEVQDSAALFEPGSLSGHDDWGQLERIRSATGVRQVVEGIVVVKTTARELFAVTTGIPPSDAAGQQPSALVGGRNVP